MIAAFLTIVGYSINDTVVVFDRIRENINKYKTHDYLTKALMKHSAGQQSHLLPPYLL